MAVYDDDEGEGKQQSERMQVFRDKYKGEKLLPLVQAMQKVQARKEALEEDLKNVNAEFDVLRFEAIPERMEIDKVENVRYEGIGLVTLTGDIRMNVLAANRQNLFSWFRKNKLGDLISETVNSSTLKSWVKKRMKEGKPYPSELLNVTPITRASIRKG